MTTKSVICRAPTCPFIRTGPRQGWKRNAQATQHPRSPLSYFGVRSQNHDRPRKFSLGLTELSKHLNKPSPALSKELDFNTGHGICFDRQFTSKTRGRTE